MAKMGGLEDRIRFGAFEVDLKSKELFKDGTRIALANQCFIALVALLEQPGQLVTREQLRRRVWPDDRVVEFDQGLHAIINRLRDALGEGPAGAGLIETLPRRGYRFTGRLQAAQAVKNPKKGLIAFTIGVSILAVGLFAWAATARLTGSRAQPSMDLGLTPLTSFAGREVAPAVSPDGDLVIFAWNGAAEAAGRFDLYRKAADSERLVRLTHDAALAMHAVWGPGGERLAIARLGERDSGIFLLTPDGGPERQLVSANFLTESFMQLTWSPDARRIAYAAVESDGWSHVNLVEVEGSEKHTLVNPSGCSDAGTPDFSADGRWLAFVCTKSVAVYDVDVMDLETRATRSLFSLQGNPQGLVWTRQGDALIVANESDAESGIWRIALNGASSRLLHSEGPLGPGVGITNRGIAFVRESSVSDIWSVDLTVPSRPSEQLISSTRAQLVPAYSPQATYIAFQSSRSGSPEIWLADADGGNPARLTTFNGPLTGAPSWCQDGRRIAFDSRASGTSAIYVLDVFEGRPRRVETTQANLSLPVWSQDCHWIIASNGRTALYRVPASGGPAEPFTEKRAYRAVIAGSRVVFNVAAESGLELWSKPLEGGPETPLEGMAPLHYSQSWTANPQGVYYTRGSARDPSIVFYDFTTHATRVLRRLEGPLLDLGGLGLSVSADGRQLLYTRAASSESDIMMIRSDQGPGKQTDGQRP